MRPRLLGLALLSVVVVACGSAAPAPTAAGPDASAPVSAAPSESTPGAPVLSPSSSATTELDADVDIGGRTMHVRCVGPTGLDEPVILLEAGLGEDGGTWNGIMRSMQATHRLCAYDRAGIGHSEAAPGRSRTAADNVADLRALIDAAGLKGPFVIGSHSYGADVAILFAQASPDDVAGLLFVDPRSPRTSQRFRDALPAVADGEPDGLVQLRYSLADFETDPLLNRENLDLGASYKEANAALDAPGPLFGDRPVVVLSAGNSLGAQLGVPSGLAKTLDAIWLASHRELAGESTAGVVEVVADSGHIVQDDKPQAVIDGLEEVLQRVAGP